MDDTVQDEAPPNKFDLDQLASIYIKMRDARDVVRREAEVKEKEIEEIRIGPN